MSCSDVKLVDSHAHLDFEAYGQDLDSVLERAFSAGLVNIVTIGAGRGLESAYGALQVATANPSIWATVGIHPHDADLGLQWSGDPAAAVDEKLLSLWEERCQNNLQIIGSLAKHPKVVALGEVGLDYHYDNSPRQLQCELFRRLVRLGVSCGLPLVIHARQAEEQVAKILVEEQADRVGGVIHCFSGDQHLAEVASGLGFSFGITGVITFKKAAQLRQVVSQLSTERLLAETDCPYLTPIPHRGKRNEPAFVSHVVECLAEVKGVSYSQMADLITANARRLFAIDQKEKQENGQIAYRYKDGLYLNITNRCTLACRFCLKQHGYEFGPANLALQQEPTVEEIIDAIDAELAIAPVQELVFCGLGEPLLRPAEIIAVCRHYREHARDMKIRINTDGLGHLVHGRNLLDELVGLLDAISVSLNAQDAKTYEQLCPSLFGRQAFASVCDFIRQAVDILPDVRASVVRGPLVDIPAAERLATSLGAKFSVRG